MRDLTSCHFGAAICTTIINLIVNAMSVLARLFVLAAMLAAAGPVYAQQGDAKRPAATGRVAIGPNPDCGIPIVTKPVAAKRAAAALGSAWECAPPYQTPAFTKPADDSVAFGSLLEAAGVKALHSAGGAQRRILISQRRLEISTDREKSGSRCCGRELRV